MEFLNLAMKRESTRIYSDQKVLREDIVKCVEAARLAPSACNAQPWKFVICDEEEIVEDIKGCIYDPLIGMNKFAIVAPAFVVVVREKRNLTSKVGELVKKTDFTSYDVGMAIENFCLEATSLGIGTCIIGWIKAKKIKDILGIPKSKDVDLVISLGYPKSDIPRKKIRKDLDQIVSFNKY